jgi:two-component system, response regulator
MSLSPRAGSGTTILLVEDDPAHAEIVRRNFAALGTEYRLDHVVDGEAALDYLRGTGAHGGAATAPRPGLVLLDLRLPKLGGLQVLAAIRSDERLECIPVVALSTSSADEDVGMAYRLGVNSYVVKPLERAAFEALLASLGQYWLEWNEQPPR